MSEFVPLLALAELPPGSSAEVVCDDRILAVFNVDGQIHVMDGICPHAGGPLGKGMLRGNIVTCPWHGWQFDVTTGRHCLNARLCQTHFDAQIVNGQICVARPSA